MASTTKPVSGGDARLPASSVPSGFWASTNDWAARSINGNEGWRLMERRFRGTVRRDQGRDVLPLLPSRAPRPDDWLEHPAYGIIVGLGEPQEELLPFVRGVLRDRRPMPRACSQLRCVA